VPEGRGGPALVLLGVVRLLAARQGGNLPAVAEQARQLHAAAEAPEATEPGLGEELRALTLISLGYAQAWTVRLAQTEPYMEQGVELARRIGRPFLEFSGLAYLAALEIPRSFARAVELGRQAIELAGRHGWNDEPAAGSAYMTLADVLAWQGRLEEAEPWMQRAERSIRAEAEPAAEMSVCYIRGQLELARGQDQQALAAFWAAERLAGHLPSPHLLVPSMHAELLQALVRVGDTERAEQRLADLSDQDRDAGEMRIAIAVLRLAQDDPHVAAAALAPVLDGSAPVPLRARLAEAFLLEAIARDALGDPGAAGRAVERALDLAEPDGALAPFLRHPAPGLLERQARERTAHTTLIAEILDLPAWNKPVPLPAWLRPPLEPLSKSEIRVLRYLPTHLSAVEIASELSVSATTVRTHLRNLYAKLGVHRRAEAVEFARAAGLLAPSAPQR
jgi:LuxR family transcriptional regulator, maltose regulon positive regulatory protein